MVKKYFLPAPQWIVLCTPWGALWRPLLYRQKPWSLISVVLYPAKRMLLFWFTQDMRYLPIPKDRNLQHPFNLRYVCGWLQAKGVHSWTGLKELLQDWHLKINKLLGSHSKQYRIWGTKRCRVCGRLFMRYLCITTVLCKCFLMAFWGMLQTEI